MEAAMGMTHLEDSTLVRGQEFQVRRMPSMPSRSGSAISEAMMGEIGREMGEIEREGREMGEIEERGPQRERERGEGRERGVKDDVIVRNGVKDGDLEREEERNVDVYLGFVLSFFGFHIF